MKADRNYPEIVAKAEKAVSGVNDPELKRVAFQKILDDLLALQSGAIPLKRATGHGAPSSRKKVKATRSGPRAYIEEMVADGFFKKPKTMAQVKAELENRGHHIALTSLSGPLQKLTHHRKLRRSRTKIKGNKQTFVYSVW
ncbi:MAG TPA: hypothetical protein VGB26_10000 [Nitrospiria bacterium]|jgi:hypothetical protein